MATISQTTPYDAVPYKSYPYPQSHPERMATIAALYGVQPQPIAKCRVLEIGCAAGGNLLPMAQRLTDSEFVGIDLSSRQIAEGNQVVEQLGVDNIKLLHGDLRELGDDLGEFDYIITHGVYSWIPDDAQEALLAACSRMLSPRGIAYISYNTFPGWHMRGMIRSIMSYRARKFTAPEDQVRQARMLLAFLAESVPSQDNPFGMLLKKELDLLQGKADYYLLHEHLEENNEPVYFYEFAERAAQHKLQYLAEADFSVMAVENFPPKVESMLKNLGSDIIELEQYMDFVRNRMFRQTLLCHADLPIDRSLQADKLLGMHVASATRPEQPVENFSDESKVTFRTAGSVTTTSDPIVKAALTTLGKCWPNYVPFSELLAIARSQVADGAAIVDTSRTSADAGRLARPLLRCYATGHVSLSVSPPRVSTEVSPTPTATTLSRHQASQGNEATSLRHETVRLDDLSRHVLEKLDGNHSREELIKHIVELCQKQVVMVRERGEVVTDPDALERIASEALDEKLRFFAANALLVG